MDRNDQDIPIRGVVSLSQMVGDDDEDTKLLRVMTSGAENYLRCFPWCKGIREAYFGDGYGGVVAVFLFLFRIEPSRLMWTSFSGLSLVTRLRHTW